MCSGKIFWALALSLGPQSSPAMANNRTEEVALPFTDGFNITVPLEDGPGPRLGGPGTAVLACLLGLVLSSTGCVFLLIVCTSRDVIVRFLQKFSYQELGKEESWKDNEKLLRRLFLEATFALLLPYAAIAAGSIWVGLKGTAPPAWLLGLLACPAVVRAAWLERQALVARDKPIRSFPWFLSKLELTDAVSDGLAVAAAAALGPEARARFAASLGQLPWLQFLLGPVGLAGALAAALAFATVLQVGLLLSLGIMNRSVVADLAGMGALASTLDDAEEEGSKAVSKRAVLIGLTRAVGEAGPQVMLQTSVLMATGQSVLAQPMVLASVLLSLGTLCLKASALARAGLSLFRGTSDHLVKYCLLAFFAPGVALLLGFALLGCTKLLMVERCPARLWGLSTGCVGVAPQ